MGQGDTGMWLHSGGMEDMAVEWGEHGDMEMGQGGCVACIWGDGYMWDIAMVGGTLGHVCGVGLLWGGEGHEDMAMG